ncbi:hypothetical protein GCM10023144_15730 [Pigmentiphaga soli]|uniref:FAD-binding PCMH-type domain-containing protein n=1 Tax=Pigmentiphaga soli TaxID=1007095 RepID=A0ABP8GSU7_9BURK
MKPGRRAFLLPQLLSSSPWRQFCHRLSRVTGGRVEDDTASADGPGRGRLAVRREQDVYHARALCAEFGVLPVPSGADETALPPDRHWLRLDTSAFDAIEAVDAARGVLTVQAGCRAGAIRERLAGLPWQWDEGGDDEPVDAWLARAGDWLPGRCADSGLLAADVLLASGQFERLGPFGADSTESLRSAAGGRLVASLFQLAGERDAVAMLAQPAWPARYRLDGLVPYAAPGAAAPVPNPGHVLLGSGGTLAWVARVQLQARPAGAPPAQRGAPRPVRDSLRETPADRQDAMVKSLFDPAGLLPG